MSNVIPQIEESDSKGKLYRTYAISICPEMEEQIKELKEKHSPRMINEWLRKLWRLGLDQEFKAGRRVG